MKKAHNLGMASHKEIFLFASLLLALSSCGAGRGAYSPYEFPTLVEDPLPDVAAQGYYRPSSFSSVSSLDKGLIDCDLETVYSFGAKRRVIPSLGKQKITVIPVDFSTYPAQTLGEEAVTNIKKAFFGSGNGNQYCSLAEYYDKASFHRFQIEGEVDDKWFRPSASYERLAALPNPNRTKAALVDIYAEALAWHNENYPSAQLESGDPVFFIYSAPYSGMDDGKSDRNNMMWAFVINDPAPIGWSSYHMFHPDGDNRVDAHTIIHEFGHMLGLVDYYDTDASSDPSPCSPLGRMDMMDCSLGDQDAFSKLLLGWNKPYVVNDSCEITLRQSGGNGDCVLLCSDWNGTPFDEYLLLDFYTPSYLNTFDAKPERGEGNRLMAKPGIKVYHVDARLGVYHDRNKAPLHYLSQGNLASYSLDFYQNNCGEHNASRILPKRDNYLIRTLAKNGEKQNLLPYFVASDRDENVSLGGITLAYRDVLFGQGEGISSYAFASKGALPFGFNVAELTSTYAKVTFAKS